MQTAIRHSQRPLYLMLRGLASLASLGVILSCGRLAMMELAKLRWPLVAGALVTGLVGWWVVAEDLKGCATGLPSLRASAPRS